MNVNSGQPLRVQEASLADQRVALELLFSHLSAEDRPRHCQQALSNAENGLVPGLWVAYRGNRMAGVILAQIQPGRTAVVSTPRMAGPETQESAGELLGTVVGKLPGQGVQLAQALLELDHGAEADLLLRCGFRHVSNLLYLVSLRNSFPAAPLGGELRFEPYSPQQHERLIRIIRQTYTGSLDCPEIDGVRDMEDVLAGYRATGAFDPTRWILARYEGQDAGCVLLTEHAASRQWELMYMGVVPQFRGRSFGIAIVRHAQWLARAADCERIVLAVDAANAPAISMYAAAGFVTWDQRSVFLRIL